MSNEEFDLDIRVFEVSDTEDWSQANDGNPGEEANVTGTCTCDHTCTGHPCGCV
ncbi:FDLD family class I lanthipeptide [Ktedonosporobacter rubrisoli]|uniref:FDLD family class I lanthipeptide n=1 Tax=Ktedonosporobacter rubrisoli TaxID=2509675 RepID=UPI0013EE42A0|nr:FDLD family class I lanthipeptide [Ktedonosporobacter rubrisoli]